MLGCVDRKERLAVAESLVVKTQDEERCNCRIVIAKKQMSYVETLQAVKGMTAKLWVLSAQKYRMLVASQETVADWDCSRTGHC